MKKKPIFVNEIVRLGTLNNLLLGGGRKLKLGFFGYVYIYTTNSIHFVILVENFVKIFFSKN